LTVNMGSKAKPWECQLPDKQSSLSWSF